MEKKINKNNFKLNIHNEIKKNRLYILYNYTYCAYISYII